MIGDRSARHGCRCDKWPFKEAFQARSDDDRQYSKLSCGSNIPGQVGGCKDAREFHVGEDDQQARSLELSVTTLGGNIIQVMELATASILNLKQSINAVAGVAVRNQKLVGTEGIELKNTLTLEQCGLRDKSYLSLCVVDACLQDLRAIFHLADENRDGKLSQEELLEVVSCSRCLKHSRRLWESMGCPSSYHDFSQEYADVCQRFQCGKKQGVDLNMFLCLVDGYIDESELPELRSLVLSEAQAR